jgi:hypothetical protein
MTDPAAVRALINGYARGVHSALRAEHPDLAWEVDVGPVDRAKLARLEARSDYANPSARPGAMV